MSIKKNNQTVLNDVINVPLTQSIINSPTTDNVIPSGKAVFDAIHKSISMTLSSTSDIITLLNTLRALASGTNATIKLYDGSGVLFPVAGNYIGTISVINGNEIIVICVNHWDSQHAYTFRIQSEDTSISVNKICTTKVSDSYEALTRPANSNLDKFACSREIVNGICYVTGEVSFSGSVTHAETIMEGLPKPTHDTFMSISTCTGNAYTCLLGTNGTLSMYYPQYFTPDRCDFTFSYPVKES